MASRTSVIGMPKARSLSACSQTLIARSCPPTTSTSPTPLARSSCGRTSWFASSVSSRIERSAESATVSTGVDSLFILEMVGGSVPSGSLFSTVCTRSRTSCVAVSMSRSRLNVATTKLAPLNETERSSLMPSTVLTAPSIRSAISDSTSSGAPPGSVVRTITVGRSTAGKRSTPRLK
jgi:hypothetical protein